MSGSFEKRIREQDKLSRQQVFTFLETIRSDMSRENWRNSDLITVLTWALPEYAKYLLDKEGKN